MSSTESIVQSTLKTKHIILPVLFGLIGVIWMFVSEFKSFGEVWLPDYINGFSILFLVCAILMVVIKDGAGMWRLWFLSDKRIGFKGLFRVRMLYEFTSAITPSIAGGATLEMLYINKEGVHLGESTAICIISLFCDELFFVLAFPIMLIFIPLQELFSISGGVSTVLSLFLIGYVLKTIWVIILFVGIFIKPEALAWIIKQIFRIKFLRKWRYSAMRTVADIRTCSRKIKHKSLTFWLITLSLSSTIWITRCCIVNFLIMAFSTGEGADFLSFHDNLIVVCRQIITMVVTMIAPTPGGSGFIEVLFENYLGEFLPATGIVLVLITAIWRVLTYYYYLIVGTIIVPKWISMNFSKHH